MGRTLPGEAMPTLLCIYLRCLCPLQEAAGSSCFSQTGSRYPLMDPGKDLTVQQAEAWYWDRRLFPSQIQAEDLL